MPLISDGTLSSPGRRRLRRNALADRLLDPREVDDALAHDRLRHLAEFFIVFRRFLSILRSRHRKTNELLLESILYAQQSRGNIENNAIIGNAAQFDNRFEAIDLAVNITAQFAESQHTERVADLFQQFELRHKFRGLVHPRAHEDIENVLDLPRSSRIAEPTVSMSLALGADSASRALSTCSSPGSSSARLNAARMSLMRSPALDERAT